jgi:hypothetical protein
VPHAAKSLLRAASSTFTLGLANPVISVLEDLFAVALFLVAVIVPILAAVGVLVVAFLVLRRLGRRAPSAAVPAS